MLPKYASAVCTDKNTRSLLKAALRIEAGRMLFIVRFLCIRLHMNWIFLFPKFARFGPLFLQMYFVILSLSSSATLTTHVRLFEVIPRLPDALFA